MGVWLALLYKAPELQVEIKFVQCFFIVTSILIFI